MIPVIIVFLYLAIVLYIGVFAFRRGKDSGEDFFLASRSLGPYVFLLSLFGTNMTAFAILGSSGMAYSRGIGVYGLMASSSGLVIPLTIFFIGTRLWALGKKHGHMTQVQYLRDRWECDGIGTFIFLLTAAMLVPYIVIAVMGGGATMEAISDGRISYALGGAIVAIVVMGYVFFGGMRGTAWVNTFQTVLFLSFGSIAFILLARNLGGFNQIMESMKSNPRTAALLSREGKIPAEEFFSYMFIPLSAMMFPHISIMCLTAEKIGHFRKTVIFYPLCIMAIWVPSVYLGVIAASKFPGLRPGEADDVIIRLLTDQSTGVGTWLAGVLGAGIMACVMASDSQIMALSTMFTQDIFAHYGGHKKFGDKAQVWTGRAFVVAIAFVSFVIALTLKDQEGIFDVAIRFAFSGFAALAPIMVAALFWKRSTKWGALAASVWVTFCMLGTAKLYYDSEAIAPRPGPPPAAGAQPGGSGGTSEYGGGSVGRVGPVGPVGPVGRVGPVGQVGKAGPVGPSAPPMPGGAPPGPPKPVPIFPQYGGLFLRSATNVLVFGYLPVMPMCLGSALIMVLFSLATKPPSRETVEKYFPKK